MQVIGKTTIHPFLFYSGKVLGYLTWILFLLSAVGVATIGGPTFVPLQYLSYALFVAGLTVSILSMFNLGRSTVLGIPTKRTMFKQTGLYRLSRNPMYVGFNLLTISSILYHQNVIVATAGLYSIFIYHLIILGEETFLEGRFGQEYLEYRAKVRRYI